MPEIFTREFHVRWGDLDFNVLFLADYNRAVAESTDPKDAALPRWSDALLARIRVR